MHRLSSLPRGPPGIHPLTPVSLSHHAGHWAISGSLKLSKPNSLLFSCTTPYTGSFGRNTPHCPSPLGRMIFLIGEFGGRIRACGTSSSTSQSRGQPSRLHQSKILSFQYYSKAKCSWWLMYQTVQPRRLIDCSPVSWLRGFQGWRVPTFRITLVICWVLLVANIFILC